MPRPELTSPTPGASQEGALPPGILAPEHEEPELVSAVHTVRPGQTLFRIAKTYGIPVADLVAANALDAGTPLSVGQTLVIPGGFAAPELDGGAPAQSAPDTWGELETDAGTPPAATLDRSTTQPPLLSYQAPLQWPVRGVLYARFGKKGREPHDGIDLACPTGTPVKTAASGVVLYAGEQRGYGLLVVVDHGQNLVTVYAHNHDLRVKTGQVVRDGQVLATVGDSGRTSGPHLHFEVRKNGLAVDPLRMLGAPPAG